MEDFDDNFSVVAKIKSAVSQIKNCLDAK